MTRLERITAAVLGVSVVLLSTHGLGRSLWLDEAWVANSALAATWRGMFYYSGWVQTTPPLFLTLERAFVGLFGLSNVSLRLVPLILFWMGSAALLQVVRRSGGSVAVLAAATVVLSGTSLEYAGTLKQYSGEFAVSAGLLWALVRYQESPNSGRLAQLAFVGCAGFALAYSMAFLWPGLVLGVALRNRLHGMVLGMAAAISGSALWMLMIRPNYSPALREFWRLDGFGSPSLWAPGLAIVIFVGLIWARSNLGGDIALVVGAIATLLVSVAVVAGLYPATARTLLFLQPLAACIFCTWLKTLPGRRYLVPLALGLAVAVLVRPGFVERRATAFEEVQDATRYLAEQVQAQDLILVHASLREPFELYSRMDRWNGPAVIFGSTGGPCCVPKSRRNGEAEVRQELDRLIPKGFQGTIWLLYTTRPSHWQYIGRNEGDLWRKHVWEGGCLPALYKAFPNVAVSPMECDSGFVVRSP